jgi:pimeloyl-ACP methyl ester carboxylesterase
LTAQPNQLGFAPNEDPFVVQHGGFYRRWLAMLDDIDELKAIVARVEATTEDKWVPLWREAGKRYEDEGDRLAASGAHDQARPAFMKAKTFYSIGRFPSEISPVKEEISADCARAYRKALEHLDPPLEVVEVACEGKSIRSHFRAPKNDTPVPAVLIMCGSDMFKEDRGWAGELALQHSLASLVMDAPGTGENPFPWEPESVKAWVAAIDWLAARQEVDPKGIGAFGISRGGYSVMQLAGFYPEMVRAVVAIAGHPFGYRMTPEETQAVIDARNARAVFAFGPPGGPATFEPWSVEYEEEQFKRWALSEQGILDRIDQPLLLINGKHDHLAPVGNIYFMLENGPVGGREARIYPDDGHCAFKHQKEWGPASFAWLHDKLAGRR